MLAEPVRDGSPTQALIPRTSEAGSLGTQFNSIFSLGHRWPVQAVLSGSATAGGLMGQACAPHPSENPRSVGCGPLGEVPPAELRAALPPCHCHTHCGLRHSISCKMLPLSNPSGVFSGLAKPVAEGSPHWLAQPWELAAGAFEQMPQRPSPASVEKKENNLFPSKQRV